MGKRIISQRRGKGSSTYRVPEQSFKPNIIYRKQNGKIIDIVSSKVINAPLAEVQYEDNSKSYIIAPEGIAVGDETNDFVMTLSNIAEGSKVFSIEGAPNTGPKICRAPGSFATLVSKSEKECILMLPSKRMIKLNPNCMATIGIPAGEGKKEKPWTKAGKKWIAMHARGKLYPRTSARAMNAVDHPFGGGGLGKVKSPVGRNAPPGRKVGPIAPKRTGKRK